MEVTRKMKFENIVPRLKLFLEQHYNDVYCWRAGESPSKKIRKETKENYVKIRQFIDFASQLKDRKRVRKSSKNDGKRTLKKILEIFE